MCCKQDGSMVLTRAIMCQGCIRRQGPNCGVSGEFVEVHIMGVPCPRVMHPDRDGVVRWFGIRWIGAPAPVRWWAMLTTKYPRGKVPGCGCVKVLKDIWNGAKTLAVP